MATFTNLKICSYNLHGFNEIKVKYINNLLNKYAIIFIQEHWLSNEQLADINKHFSCFTIHGVSAMDSSDLLIGRPHGGCLVILHDDLGANTTFINTKSNRLCCISILIHSMTLFLFSVYMPIDINEMQNINEYNDVLSEISQLCLLHNVENLCILGDFNTDLGRENSWHTRSLKQFVRSEKLLFAQHNDVANVRYTYRSRAHDTCSTLDHFIVSPCINDIITAYYSICEDVDNMSDHTPLILHLNLNVSLFETVETKFKPRKKWSNIEPTHINLYRENLDFYLYSYNNYLLNSCITCNDIYCACDNHIAFIQKFHDVIISALINASSVIPETQKQSKTSATPGWKELVEPKRKTALFWRDLWLHSGAPENSVVTDVMKYVRHKYHYTIRYVKNNRDNIKKQNMARAISENNSRNFWSESRKTRNKNRLTTKNVDNVSSDEDIAQLFACKYKQLYNSVNYSDIDLINMFKNNMSDIKTKCAVEHDNSSIHTHEITVEQVQCAINKMKSGKSDTLDGLVSDNFKYGTLRLFEYIAVLFNCMLIHGVAPSSLSISTLVPIIKNKRQNKSDSNNYRAIAISSLFAKILDLIILEKHSSDLLTDPLQFGFKKQSSTTICTSLMMETIDYYRENGSDCYLLLLDASKAFDRVAYVKLFEVLRCRNLCPILLRLFMNMYITQKIQVRWNDMLSEQYQISNGVKQGGILSPVLYSVYVDNLIKQLRNSNIGCKYKNEYMGFYGYADDISLLCPTLTGIQYMLDICENYAVRFKINYNAKKSQLLLFSHDNYDVGDLLPLSMRDGSIIPYVTESIHLGTPINTKLYYESFVIEKASNELYRKTNHLLADYSFTESVTLAKLFNSYCMNIYSSQLWQYNKFNCVNSFYVSWRKCIRRVWKLNSRTHSNLLHHINDCLPIDILLEKRCIKFLWNLINSNYLLHSKIAKYSLSNCDTKIGENIRYFMYKYKMSYKDWYSPLYLIYKKLNDFSCDHYADCTNIGKTIRELCQARDGGLLQGFQINELNFMIENFCID